MEIAVEPGGLALADGTLWVASARAGTITPVDADGRPGVALRVGDTPARIAAGANALWVTDAANGEVVPVALGRRDEAGEGRAAPPRVLAPLRGGADASDVALAGGAVWVASSADGRVHALGPGGERKALRTGAGPVALAADERSVAVADPRAGTLTVIGAQSRAIRSRFEVGGTPVDVALAGDTAWIADSTGGRIVELQVQSGSSHSIAVGRRPVALATAGADVYVLTAGTRELVRVRDGRVRSRRAIGSAPTALAVDDRFVWVSAGRLLRFER